MKEPRSSLEKILVSNHFSAGRSFNRSSPANPGFSCRALYLSSFTILPPHPLHSHILHILMLTFCGIRSYGAISVLVYFERSVRRKRQDAKTQRGSRCSVLGIRKNEKALWGYFEESVAKPGPGRFGPDPDIPLKAGSSGPPRYIMTRIIDVKATSKEMNSYLT